MKEILLSTVNAAATSYMILILLRAVLSWVPSLAVKMGAAAQILYGVVDPFFVLIRRIMPVSGGRVDFAPVVAILLVEVARKALLFVIIKAAGA